MIRFQNTPFLYAALAGASVLAFSAPALAQTPPASVEAARVVSDIQTEAPEYAAPTATTTGAPVVNAPDGADKIFFTLRSLDIAGAVKVPAGAMTKYYADDIGQRISLKRVYEIAALITRDYRNRGYLLSQAVVPQQNINSGKVRLQIVEGRIGNFTIQGEPRSGNDLLNKYAAQLQAEQPLTAAKMERYLLLMNDIPGLSVRSVLAPSTTEAGAADLTLVVSEDHFQGFASIDNYGSKFIGQERITVGGQLNSIFGFNEKIEGTVLYAPDEGGELAYVYGAYHQPIGDQGMIVGASLSHSVTDPTLPGTLGGLLGPEGEATTLSFDLMYPVIRSRLENFNLGFKFDYAQSKNNFDLAPALETEDNLRVIRGNAEYSFLDGWRGYNILNGEISQGLNIFNASKETDPNISRTAGEADFLKFNFDATRIQPIYGKFSAQLGATGQWSAHNLLAGEEFGIGGSRFGRGYDFSEVTGEHGLAGKIDVIYSDSLGYSYLSNYQAYAFYDVGRTWNKDPGAGQPSHTSVASAGVGTRLTFTDWLSGEALVAFPLTRQVQSRGRSGDDARFHFSLTSQF